MPEKTSDKMLTVYRSLKEQIASLEIRPGQIITEKDITTKFNVSRTPVREAVIKLIHEGLLTEKNGRVYCSNLSYEDIKNIYEVRDALEQKAIEITCKKTTKEFITQLNSLNNQMKYALENNQYHDFFNLDSQIHESIIKKTGNKKMIEVFLTLTLQISRIRHLTTFDSQRMESTYYEHKEIIETIDSNNSGLAKKLLNEHLDKVLLTVKKHMDIYNL